MNTRNLLTICFFVHLFSVTAQQKMTIPDDRNVQKQINPGSTLKKAAFSGTIMPGNITENWNITLKNYNTYHHTSCVPNGAFDLLKEQSNLSRNQTASTPNITERHNVTPPVITRNFRGNARDNSVPMDNSMAVSHNGFIVSGINSNVIFTGPDGKITFSKGLPDFFTLLGLGTRMYDPRVIYDVEARRFIFMCLHGSEPSNTFLCIAFSKTEDPNGEWNYYKVDGNPSGDNHWFDYPNIAVSAHDFYIAGLMRDTKGDWQYSVLYQLDKNDGYEGKDLSWKYYNELLDADGKKSFNLVPTPSGWKQLLSPGMYFVSNQALGGDTYNLYYTTGSVHQQPSLVSLQTTGPRTTLAPDGRQPATTNMLNTFDSRIWSALYLNGTIHIGSHVNTPTGDVGLFYARLQISDFKVHSDVLTISGKDMAFPSFSAFGTEETSPDILINYLISGPDLFPSQEQRICRGFGNDFEWSNPVTLRSGVSIVDVLADNRERWGDYTTSCRRFINNRTESWVTGCFGEGRSYGTWIGQFMPEDDVNTKTAGEFIADKTSTTKNTLITFSDLTEKNPVSWHWTFEKGIPASSEEKNPQVYWEANGAYDVTLIVTNESGTDTVTKSAYIHIQDPVIKPVADFSMDKDTIYQDDTVQFMDLSSNNPVNLKWTFQQGNPSGSTEKNPSVRYSKAGSYLVSLTATNIAGSNTKIKSKAITVLERKRPVSAFTATKTTIDRGESVTFFDISDGGPKAWLWTFEQGTPPNSSEKNPTIIFDSEGSFDVTLIVSNDLGSDTIIKKDYITVATSKAEVAGPIQNLKLFPNPVGDKMITVTFNTNQTSKYVFEIYDIHGNHIKTLYDDKVSAGPNELKFNVYSLPPGQYYLVISSGHLPFVKMPFVVLE